MPNTEPLVRKQFLIHRDQIKKINLLAEKSATSAADMVRRAIDAYSPDVPDDMEVSELLELVSTRVKEAIADVRRINKRVTDTMEKIGIEGA